MLVYVINRLLQAVGVLAVMSVLVFVGIYLIGDPTAMLVSPEATTQEREAVRIALGLDRPVWVQYLSFMGNALQGDFGRSFLTGQPALQLIFERMPATFASICSFESRLRSSLLPLGSPIMPVAPPTMAIGL